MSDTILNGDFTVYYSADGSRKQIKWSGSTGGPYTVNQLYSALQDLFDELAQLDDPVPMSAQTPTEYTIGCIDPSDTVPWFIDDQTTQHLKGGSLKSAKYERIAGTQPGIVKVLCSANAGIVYGDIGNAVNNGTSTGVLLDVHGSGPSTVLFIRPTDATATHDWTATGATITCNGHTATSHGSTPVYTGEYLWANIYSLGSLAGDKGNNAITDLYVYQNGAKVTGWNNAAPASYQWWPTGHCDVLLKVKTAGATAFTGSTHTNNVVDGLSIDTSNLVIGQPIYGAGIPAGATIASITGYNAITISVAATASATVPLSSNTVDSCFVTIFPREYDNTYGYFIVQLTSGGRNPVPLATGDDLNNHTGTRRTVVSAGSGTFVVGEILYVGATLPTATKKAVITAVSGSAGSQTLTYYLIGTLADFAASDALKGAVSAAAGTAGAPSDNPAASNPKALGTPPTVAYAIGGYQVDIVNGNGAQPYSVQLDCKNLPLSTVYEWAKYVTRRGGTTTANTNGVEGERFIGLDYKLSYNSIASGTFAAGSKVFQVASGASGVVVTCDTANKIVLLRNSRGTFTTGVVTDGTTSTDAGTTATTIGVISYNPFGTFAGGKFFFAPGVYPINYPLADAQNYQLTDNKGAVQTPPNYATIIIEGLSVGDGTGVFRTVASAIDKTAYTVAGTLSAAATSVVVATAIGTDEPMAGFLRIVKKGVGWINEEHRYRYASWTASTFTLASATGNTVSGAPSAVSGNLILLTLGSPIDAAVQVGDMVLNSTSNDYGAVVKIVDTTHIQVRVKTPSNWSAADVLAFNVLVTSYANANADNVYVPIIDQCVATGNSVSNTLIFNTTIPVLVRVRQYKSIVPFEQTAVIVGTGLTITAIRSADTIAS